MLEELYRYAVEHKLAARPGFKPKRPKGYFHLSAVGQFLDLEVREKDYLDCVNYRRTKVMIQQWKKTAG